MVSGVAIDRFPASKIMNYPFCNMRLQPFDFYNIF
jgi:hypothetical protein